jgi:predicted amidohydrolase YtcJ
VQKEGIAQTRMSDMCVACNPGAFAILRTMATRRSFMTGSTAFATASALLARPTTSVAQTSGRADLIFSNGPIHTMADTAPGAEAIAVRGGRISAVGTMDAVLAQQGPGTRMIDLAGHTLLPGLIDPHMHFTYTAFDAWVDVGPFTTKTIDDALQKLRAAAQVAKPGDWVRGQMLDPSLMPGVPLSKARLDAVAPANPVFVLESNGHIAHVNSKALEAAGVGRDTPDPPQGRYVRDADGNLTGRLEEPPSFGAFLAKMPMPSAPELAQNIRRLFDRAASVGCTTMHDAGIGLLGTQDVALLEGVMQGNPPIRYGGFLIGSLLDKWTEMGLKPGGGSDRFRATGIKFWMDGSTQAYTGYLREPYLNSTSRGGLDYTPEQITADIQRAHDIGWQIGVHANGDAAIDIVVDAYAAVLAESPRVDHRNRIEHCTLLHPEQIKRMAELGLSPSFLIGHVHYWGRAFRDRILGRQRADLLDRCRSALDGGLRISLHSDWNTTPIEPLGYVDQAVNRVMQDGGDVLNPPERISPLQAVKAVTIDAAWQCRMDHITGSLEIGKYADLVVLDRDPLAVAPTAINSTKVIETWLEGERRHVG